jgi:formate/nitrite transporter
VAIDYVLRGTLQTTPLDYVKPPDLIDDVLAATETKASLAVKDLLLRGFIAGALLGFATALTAVVRSQGLPPIVGAILFPVGFVLLVLLGLELATGNFALFPKGLAAGRVNVVQLVRNWSWVYVGNLAGCVFFGALFYAGLTTFGQAPAGPVGDAIAQTALAKVAYQGFGAAGWGAALVKAVLANWMVTVGVMMAFVARSVPGKVVAMWLPIMTFFALGLEHSIVNMFVVPTGMLLGADISLADWWLWNQIPVTLGNVVGGAVLTGLALYVTHKRKPA